RRQRPPPPTDAAAKTDVRRLIHEFTRIDTKKETRGRENKSGSFFLFVQIRLNSWINRREDEEVCGQDAVAFWCASSCSRLPAAGTGISWRTNCGPRITIFARRSKNSANRKREMMP